MPTRPGTAIPERQERPSAMMCDFCAGAAPGTGTSFDASRLWRIARQIEAGMPGSPAIERDWSIFSGRATGSIGFAALQRLAESRRAAMTELAAETAAPTRFRCEAVK